MKINSFSTVVVGSDRPCGYQITILNYLCFILATNSEFDHGAPMLISFIDLHNCVDLYRCRVQLMCVREHLSPAVSVKSHIRGNLLLPCCVFT